MHQQILKDLKAKKYSPIYLLQGSEPYFVDLVANYLEHKVLSESEKAFNLTVAYGKDTNAITILNALRRPPMLSQHQVVMIKEAQDMKEVKLLADYCEKPIPSSILVLVFKQKKLAANLKITKAIKKNGVILSSTALYDSKVGPWVLGYLKEQGYPITPAAIEMLVESLGNKLSKIANELDKMLINLPKGTKIDPSIIQKHIGISKEYNSFELQKSLAQRDHTKSYRIARYFASNPKAAPLPLLIGSLFSYFSKLYIVQHNLRARDEELQGLLGLNSSYFIKEYRAAARRFNLAQTIKVLELLYHFDLRSKGIETGPGDSEDQLITEMTMKILAV